MIHSFVFYYNIINTIMQINSRKCYDRKMKQTVLLLFGGESSEHEVSIASATNVYEVIDKTIYDILPVYIDRMGGWWLLESFDQYMNFSASKQIVPVFGEGAFRILQSDMLRPDVIFPVLHGKNGEDGSVQAVAQLLHIPVVGCDMIASGLCMDKVATKQVMQANNVSVVPYIIHLTDESLPNIDDVVTDLGLPLFVKPSRAGSSVGVVKVHTKEEFAEAVNKAHQHDKTVLIEKAVQAREIEVSVFGTPPYHQISQPGEVKPGAEFYSYEDKYDGASTSSLVIPAELSEDKMTEIQELGKKIYRLLGCKGMARVDFFLTPDGDVYLNEVNTLPGFTNISMYAKLWQNQGVSGAQLTDALIRDALGEHVTISA